MTLAAAAARWCLSWACSHQAGQLQLQVLAAVRSATLLLVPEQSDLGLLCPGSSSSSSSSSRTSILL